jgi:DNA-binding FadR family transcriptional regulator
MHGMNARERSQERSRAIRAYICDRISAGDWKSGDRVPTERVFSVQFEIARNTVRSVLQELEREGLIIRHVGKGTFVAEGKGERDTAQVLSFGEVSPTDIMEVRLLVEPGLGELAVRRATQSDLDGLRECLDCGEAARSWREFERWDAEFHEALASATKNHALIDILRSINQLRGDPVWGELKKKSLTKVRRAVYERQHRAILTALTRRESETACKAIRHHLLTVRENLLGY